MIIQSHQKHYSTHQFERINRPDKLSLLSTYSNRCCDGDQSYRTRELYIHIDNNKKKKISQRSHLGQEKNKHINK